MAPIWVKIDWVSISIDIDTAEKVEKAFEEVTIVEKKEIINNLLHSNPDLIAEAYEKKFWKTGTENSVNNSLVISQEQREKELWEYASQTAKDKYKNLSDIDKEYLRRITRYEAWSMVLLDEEGNELFRSYGILQPESLFGTKSFTKSNYKNAIGSQKYIEAKWQDWYEGEIWKKLWEHRIRKEVLEAVGMKENITWGNTKEWNQIYKLFSKVKNNVYLSEDIPWKEIAMHMLWIPFPWHIWTNEKISSSGARRYDISSWTCELYSNYIHINHYRLTIVGLENMQH